MDAYLDILAAALAKGLPVLAVQIAVTGAILLVGAWLSRLITPFDEDRLVAGGNVAAGIVLGAGRIALALPLAATLASQSGWLSILLWGSVALVLQLAWFAILLAPRATRAAIEAGNVARAVSFAAAQVAFALVNAGAMLG